jgi:hypothetical protein
MEPMTTHAAPLRFLVKKERRPQGRRQRHYFVSAEPQVERPAIA